MTPPTIKDRIQFVHEGGAVVRFHQHIGHVLDTDARHSHGVAVLCYFLTDGAPSVNLLMAALSHDLAEQVVGDIPYTAKRNISGLKATCDAMEQEVLSKYGLSFTLTEAEQRTLRLADALDGMLYCCHEAALGNHTTLRRVYAKWLEGLRVNDGSCNDLERSIVRAVERIWDESNDLQGPQYTISTECRCTIGE
jgi:hypothetical protein